MEIILLFYKLKFTWLIDVLMAVPNLIVWSAPIGVPNVCTVINRYVCEQISWNLSHTVQSGKMVMVVALWSLVEAVFIIPIWPAIARGHGTGVFIYLFIHLFIYLFFAFQKIVTVPVNWEWQFVLIWYYFQRIPLPSWYVCALGPCPSPNTINHPINMMLHFGFHHCQPHFFFFSWPPCHGLDMILMEVS